MCINRQAGSINLAHTTSQIGSAVLAQKEEAIHGPATKPNPIELYEAAFQGFRTTLAGVKADQLTNATPCTAWSVQNLINHNIQVAGFALGALKEDINVNPMDVGVLNTPLPAGGAVDALEAGVAKVMELMKAPGSAATQINSPFGQMTRAESLMAPVFDLLVHRWDLAKGTNQSTNLDPGLVEVIFNGFAGQWDGMRAATGDDVQPIIGPEVKVSDSASMQDKLIAIAGRTP